MISCDNVQDLVVAVFFWLFKGSYHKMHASVGVFYGFS